MGRPGPVSTQPATPASSATSILDVPLRAAADTRLIGACLQAARIAWLILAAFFGIMFAMDLPVYVAALHTTCTGTLCPSPQLTPAGARLVARLGLPPEHLRRTRDHSTPLSSSSSSAR